MRHLLGRLASFASAALLLLSASIATAEVQRFEAIGTVPVRAGEVATRGTRDAAVNEALREAVHRVARELLIDAPLSANFDDAALDRVLGERVLPYTSRYRIVDDQGERPALFGDGPDALREYVVIIDVSIDAERVEQRLVEAGLLVREAVSGLTTRVRIEIEGLLHYPAYVAMRDLISSESGAVSVQPITFARGHAVVEILLPGRPVAGDREALAKRLVRAGPPALTIETVRVDDEALVLAATWTPPPPPSDPDAPSQ